MGHHRLTKRRKHTRPRGLTTLTQNLVDQVFLPGAVPLRGAVPLQGAGPPREVVLPVGHQGLEQVLPVPVPDHPPEHGSPPMMWKLLSTGTSPVEPVQEHLLHLRGGLPRDLIVGSQLLLAGT